MCVTNILVCTALLLEPTFSLIFTGELISAISLPVRILSVKSGKKLKIHLEVLIATCHRYIKTN